MKLKNILLTAFGVAGVTLASYAALQVYKSIGAAGTAAAPAVAIFPADPNCQIRIVGVNWQSDTNNARLEFTTGNGAYYETAQGASSSAVTNMINSTNGLVPGSVMCLQHLGTNYLATLSTFNQSSVAGQNGTNIVLASGGWGVQASAGDDIYQMSSTNYLFAGATTNGQNGQAIYVGNFGRPVAVRLNPSLVTNAIPIATAHYDAVGN